MANLSVFCEKLDMPQALDYVEIGKRLKRLRRVLGLNQREMSELVDCTPPSWNAYEKGNGLIQIPQAMQISVRYGVPLDWIYKGDPAMLPNHIASEIAKIEKAEAEGTLEPERRIRRQLG